MDTKTLSKVDPADVFKSQKRKALQLKKSTAQERIAKLSKLKEAINANAENILEALYLDFKKPPQEAGIEISGITNEIDFINAFLESWMTPQVVPTPEDLGGEASDSKIILEPKGVVLFLTPWNYPFLLTIRPLVACIAAGNAVTVKPSELSPHSATLMKEILGSVFPQDEIYVFEGGAEVATELLKLPYRHIFYTGGPQVAKIVMKAAAENLSSLTLELGGKSPSIIDDSADFVEVAGKVAFGKYLNCGQTCMTTDYVLVSEKRKDEFLDTMKATIEAMYGREGPGISSTAYARLVDRKHFNRVKNLLQDALDKGAILVVGGQIDEAENYISPTLLADVRPDDAIMKEEIFGPVLPVMTYKTLDDAIDFVNQRDHPLGLYVLEKIKQISTK
jgi:aldehyde dehydrogenase (NAD+)